MAQIILQYVLVVLLVVGIGYLMYLFKEKGVKINEDYFGITYNILNSLGEGEGTPENIKKILRVVSKTVVYVEDSYKNEENNVKEDKALELSKQALSELNFSKTISDENIRYIIRLTSALLPATNKEKS